MNLFEKYPILIWVGVVCLVTAYAFMATAYDEFSKNLKEKQQGKKWQSHLEWFKDKFHPLNNPSYPSTDEYYGFLCGIQPIGVNLHRQVLIIASANMEYPKDIEGNQLDDRAYERFVKSVIDSGRGGLFIANFSHSPGQDGCFYFVTESSYHIITGRGLERMSDNKLHPQFTIYSFRFEPYEQGVTWYLRVQVYDRHGYTLTSDDYLQNNRVDPIRDFLTENVVSAIQDEIKALKPTKEHVEGFRTSAGGRSVVTPDIDDEEEEPHQGAPWTKEEPASSAPPQTPRTEVGSSQTQQSLPLPAAAPHLAASSPSETSDTPLKKVAAGILLAGLVGSYCFIAINGGASEKPQVTAAPPVAADVTAPAAENTGNADNTDNIGNSPEETVITITPSPVPGRVETPLQESEVQEMLNRWRATQNDEAYSDYASLYTADFIGIKRTNRGVTRRLGRDAWLSGRKAVMEKNDNILVTVEDTKINISGSTAVVRFTQTYQAGAYADKGVKVVSCRREEGGVKIFHEEMESVEPVVTAATTEPKTTPSTSTLQTEDSSVSVNPAEPDNPDPQTVTLASGLKYQDLKAGIGQEAKRGDTSSIRYTVHLEDGTLIAGAKNKPQEVDLNDSDVIAGLREGVIGMKPGGQRRLFVPSDLAYGEAGSREMGVAPNTPIEFVIELVSVRVGEEPRIQGRINTRGPLPQKESP